MPPEEATQVADEVLLAHAGNPLTDIQRMILRESLAGTGYESMEGYTPQHIKNEGKKLWDLLSEALGEKVSKTSFKGALEKRWKLGKLVPKPSLLSIYNPQTWVGREAIIDECLPKLQGQARILWITGISGIGKTALGECLASQAWDGEPAFQWLYLEILEGQSPEFVSVAADLLAKLGDIDLDPQERNDPKRLMERLLRKLKVSRYWLQVDSLERLLNSEQPTETEFADHHWVTFIQRCLTEPNFVSRLVLTAQALPSSLAELEDRYPNLWQVITLQGLLANQQDAQQPNEHLELFAKNGLRLDDLSSVHLRRIGQIYEGHPLVLQVIAKEILAAPFDGNVTMYWERYDNEFEQVARELQAERVSPELYNQALQRRVRRRVELSLKRLPTDALDLLCRSSVYRRPVPETFWLSLLEEQTSQRREQAYQILNERAFVEREGIHQNQFLIRQHNLVRAVAYDLLKTDPLTWENAERQAADSWLSTYQPASNADNLEKVRGYLESFNHYCNVEDWEKSAVILFTQWNVVTKQELYLQLDFWGYYSELISLLKKVLERLDIHRQSICLNSIGWAYYYLGDYKLASDFHQKNLRLSHLIDDHRIKTNALNGLAKISYSLKEYNQSVDIYKQSLELNQTFNDRIGEARALNGLGFNYLSLGNFDESVKHHKLALGIFQESGDFKGEVDALKNLGNTYVCLGQIEAAMDFYASSLKKSQEIGDVENEMDALHGLGKCCFYQEAYLEAIKYSHQCISIACRVGDHWAEGNSLWVLGCSLLELNQYIEARNNLESAFKIFSEISENSYKAEVLKTLISLHRQLGERNIALAYCEQALTQTTELDTSLTKEFERLKKELETDSA